MKSKILRTLKLGDRKGKEKMALEWKEKKVNNIETNPRDCFYAVGKLRNRYRLYRIVEQYPVKEDGYTIVNGADPELYVLFEALDGMPKEKCASQEEVEHWMLHDRIWDGIVFKNDGGFIRAFKTLDEAKARAEIQLKVIDNILNEYF